MELFVLYPKTAEILENLRNNKSWMYDRAQGKTTAVLLRAKEMIDNGEVVYVACAYPEFLRSQYGMLTGKKRSEVLNELKIVTKPKHLQGCTRGTLLVDEPCLLNWTYDEWTDVYRTFTVVKAGY
jgi:hypothetical protein